MIVEFNAIAVFIMPDFYHILSQESYAQIAAFHIFSQHSAWSVLLTQPQSSLH